MILKHAISRASYYLADLPLLLRAMAAYLRAYFLTPDSDLTAFAAPASRRKPRDIERIRNSVGLCFRLGASAGLTNTCLLHSIVLCRLLNQHGTQASVVFAARKTGDTTLAGHCWVSLNNSETEEDWHVIFKYP